PKFDKIYIYKLPNTKYEMFSNAYAYSFIVKNKNPVPSQLIICNAVAKEWQEIKKLEDTEIDNIIKQHLTIPLKLQDYFQFVVSSKEQMVVRYDVPSKLFFLIQNSNLLEYIYESVEYGSTDKCRRKKVIKVRIVNHLHENLENNYIIYIARMILNNYLLLCCSRTIAAKEHHYSAWVSVTRVSRNKTKEHSDKYYCLASIKGARQFAQTFSDVFIIVSQDDKSEIGLGTSSITHIKDISSLVSNDQYFGILKINNNIKSIWILLVDRGPDENPCHFKNIQSYCKLFRKFNLDYLTVRTHALGQSKYNPVERGKSTLSSKLAGIILPINHFGNHLDSQDKTIDTKLAAQNFAMLIEKHCNLCQYSLDIKQCNNSNCCKPARAQKAMNFLQLFDSFLSPVTKAQDDHYINPIHLFQYSNKFKIPGYDIHCLSISQTTYHQLCCSICHKYFSTQAYMAKHKYLLHPSPRERPKKNQSTSSELVVEFTNSKEIDNFGTLHSEQNRRDFTSGEDFRDYVSNLE
ncbi:36957_t:CDS:2, partial [Gigaspora margarita]